MTAVTDLALFPLDFPTEGARGAVRASDPASSHAAANAYSMKWDCMNMKALRVHYQAHLAGGGGLTNYEVEVRARQWGGLGKSPWKRISELHTKFDPPLVEHLRDQSGQKVMRPGEFDSPVEVFAITAAGIDCIEKHHEGH